MEPAPKAPKLSEETDTGLLVDRISNLPPELIGNILSLLPTKEAVATSVLSSKWNRLWTLITCLDLVDEHPESRTEIVKAKFVSFVYRVLLNRKPTPLNYLRLTCRRTYFSSHLRAWLSDVIPIGLKELDLSIPLRDNSHVIPSALFSCQCLVKLKLRMILRIYVPLKVCLPSLKDLTLTDVEFPDNDALRRLLIGCPILEVFESTGFFGHDRRTLLPLELFSSTKLAKLILGSAFVMNLPTEVSLPSLEALHLSSIPNLDNDSLRRLLRGCPLLRELNITKFYTDVLHIEAPKLSDLTIYLKSRSPNSRVVIDTPALQYWTVDGAMISGLEMTDSTQLVEANIRFVHPRVFRVLDQVASNMIMAVSRVQKLYLCSEIMEVIVKHGCKLPKFDKLTTLTFGVIKRVGWALLPKLLENSPVLETLIFQNGLRECHDSSNAIRYVPQEVPSCLSHYLKVIQVNNFEGDRIEEEEMIKYFIKNSGVLKDLTIRYSRRGSEDFSCVNACDVVGL